MKTRFLKILEEVKLKEDEREDDWADEKNGAGVIFMARDTGRMLISFRSEHVDEPHTWGTWGGGIERGESPKEAAAREAYEEADYSTREEDIHLLYIHNDPDSDFKYFNYLVVVPTQFKIPVYNREFDGDWKNDDGSNWESENAKWVEFGDWPSPLHFGLKNVLEYPKSMKILKELSEKFSAAVGSPQQAELPQDC